MQNTFKLLLDMFLSGTVILDATKQGVFFFSELAHALRSRWGTCFFFWFELVPSKSKLMWDLGRFSTLLVSENPSKAWRHFEDPHTPAI